jgi:hypothetical protein
MILLNRYMPENRDVIKKNSPIDEVYLDVRGVINPSSRGSRNVRYRVACSKGWETQFEIIWENTIINRHQMEAILNDAGSLIGLADARSIGYGRFEVMNYEVEEYAKKASS